MTDFHLIIFLDHQNPGLATKTAILHSWQKRLLHPH